MEIALIFIVRIETGVGVSPHEIATRGGRLEQRDVVDVHAGRLGRVEDVRHVHEDGDVLAHLNSCVLRLRGGRSPAVAAVIAPGLSAPRRVRYAGPVVGIRGAPSGPAPLDRPAARPRRRRSPCSRPIGGPPRRVTRSRRRDRQSGRRPGGRSSRRSRQRRPTAGSGRFRARRSSRRPGTARRDARPGPRPVNPDLD